MKKRKRYYVIKNTKTKKYNTGKLSGPCKSKNLSEAFIYTKSQMKLVYLFENETFVEVNFKINEVKN